VKQEKLDTGTGRILAELLGRVWQINRMASTRSPGGLSPSHYRTLGLLADRGACRVGDLAEGVHVSQPGMTKILHVLAELGAVERAQDPDDSRATLVSVTPTGRALIRRRSEEIVALLLPSFTALSEAERTTLRDAVDILAKHMPGTSTAPGKETR